MLMRTRLIPIVSAILAFAWASPAVAQAQPDGIPLTRQRVAELVKTAPAAQVAKSEVGVSRAAVTAAGTISLDNPLISGLGGVRFNPGGDRTFNGVATLSWPVDLGGKRGTRLDAAQAQHRAAIDLASAEERRLLLGAMLLHAAVLRDVRQVAIAAQRHSLSGRLYAAAQRRRAAGSVPELDVALAALQEMRDASAEASAAGARDGDELALATLLGIGERPKVTGSLVPSEEAPPLPGLLKRAEQRADVRAASAALGAARAKAERERAARFPTISILAQYERDDQSDIGLVGLAVPLPILNANRTEVLTSAAEVGTAKARAAQIRTQATGQLRELYARYLATRAAVDSLAPTAALATRSVSLATRGYELGENDLASVLLVWREAVQAEEGLLEAEHRHAAVKIELLIIGGKIPQ
jgi:cobalt-zinc-cadmium efflux system outer membrane protein